MWNQFRTSFFGQCSTLCAQGKGKQKEISRRVGGFIHDSAYDRNSFFDASLFIVLMRDAYPPGTGIFSFSDVLVI